MGKAPPLSPSVRESDVLDLGETSSRGPRFHFMPDPMIVKAKFDSVRLQRMLDQIAAEVPGVRLSLTA